MDVYDSEKEQLQKIKAWIQENGLSVVLGISLGLGGVYGWRYWQAYRINASSEVSAQLAEISQQVETKQYEGVADKADALIREHDDSLYGDMAALMAARALMAQGQPDQAATQLQLVLNTKENGPVQHVARLRLARVYMAQAKYAEAQKLLSVDVPDAFAREYEELRGDLAFYQGDQVGARTAYRNALALAANGPDTQFLQMKIDDLAAGKEQ